MNQVFGRFGLRTKFAIALAGLITIVTGVFGGVIGQHSVAQLRERIGQSLAVDAQRASDRLKAVLTEKSRDLLLVARSDVMQRLNDKESITSSLEYVRHNEPAFVWLAAFDSFGILVAANSPAGDANPAVALPDSRDQFRDRMVRLTDLPPPGRAGEIVVVPSLKRQRQIELTRPIRDAGDHPVGAIVSQLNWEWIQAAANAMVSPDEDGQRHRELLIISSYDTVLAGPPDLLGKQLLLPAINQARAGIYGWASATWPDSGRYITGTNFVSGEGEFLGPGSAPMRWTVMVREAEHVAFLPAQQLQFAIVMLGAALSAIVALLGWIIAGIITRPLRQIASAADRLRQGENVELPILRSSAEIERLSASLRALVATLTFKQVRLDELESAHQHDPLTGLLNRAGLQSWLARALAQARVEPSGLLILVGDLDGFKLVNDSRGHLAGDKLLQEVARRLQSAVRARDAVTRMGGDEFVVALHAPLGLADERAVETAYRLWSRITEPYVIEGSTIHVGLSLGAAGWPEDDRQIDFVLNKADLALYAAKRAGKGRIVFHAESTLVQTMPR